MIDTIGRTTVLVEDYDDAIEFYREKLDFDVLFDGVLGDGTRLVHVGPSSIGDPGLWLFEARSAEQRARVGNQTGGHPLAVFYVSDCREASERLRERGVTVHGDSVVRDGSASIHVEDPYGNTYVLEELGT